MTDDFIFTSVPFSLKYILQVEFSLSRKRASFLTFVNIFKSAFLIISISFIIVTKKCLIQKKNYIVK